MDQPRLSPGSSRKPPSRVDHPLEKRLKRMRQHAAYSLARGIDETATTYQQNLINF
jgi:hypothetical protein